MHTFQLQTPVAFIIFNRPDTTKKVFEEIRRARPPKLLVIADGPRPGRQAEADNCAAARAVVDHVDWPCEILKNYSDINLGCRQRVSSGLDWIFDTVEEAIILEDDCLPHQSFFRFCEELLERYRQDQRVMMISGDNFQFGRKRTQYSYYFSHFTHIWGWATWRRAWSHYDVGIKLWPEIRDGNWLKDCTLDKKSAEYWEYIFDLVHEGRIDTWDHQWHFASWVQNGLTILPSVNLVSNIGFGSESTHTSRKSKFACMQYEAMSFPLFHPPFVIRDSMADMFTDKTMFLTRSLFSRAKRTIKRLIS